MQGANTMTKDSFFSNVVEEIFELDPSQGTIVNYISIVEHPEVSMISMLAGPTAMAAKPQDIDDEGYRS